jgi:hypothetical protein
MRGAVVLFSRRRRSIIALTHSRRAARTPDRPNPIDIHRVTVTAVEPAKVHVAALEASDGTPLDLKIAGASEERSAASPNDEFRRTTTSKRLDGRSKVAPSARPLLPILKGHSGTLAQANDLDSDEVGLRSSVVMSDRGDAMRQYLAIWNGEQPLDALDALVTPGFIGHIGSRDRDLSRLKEDIAAYRGPAPSAQFAIDHQFGDDEYLATRTSVHFTGQDGDEVALQGINISRWEGDRLAEEWAVWETPPTS